MSVLASAPQAAEPAVAASPNGITHPPDYRNRRLVASSQRNDNNTLRVIPGKDTTIDAARTGNTDPWPDGHHTLQAGLEGCHTRTQENCSHSR